MFRGMWSNEFENHKKVDRNALMRCMSAYMYACMYVCMNECTCTSPISVCSEFVVGIFLEERSRTSFEESTLDYRQF